MSQNLPLRTSGGRGGILVIGLVALIVVLVIVGLVLPPISLPSRLGLVGGGCKTLSAKNPQLDHQDGLSVLIDPEAKGTLALKLESFQSAKLPDNSTLKSALKSLPRGYSAKGPVFQIATCGTRAVPATVSVLVPDDADQLESLDLFTWNGKAWEWFGGHVDTDNNVILAQVKEVPQNVVVAQSSSTPSVVASDLPASGDAVPDGLQAATMLFIPGLLPADDGAVNGDPDGLPKPPEGTTAAQYISIRNWTRPGRYNVALVSDMIVDPKVRATHAKVVASLVTKGRYAGAQIDYRGLIEDDRPAFTDLIVQVGDALHKVNKKLVVVLPAPLLRNDGTWDTTGYDWKAISASADWVQVDLPTDPAAYGKSSAEALVGWITGEASRSKLLLGLTSLSVDQVGRDVTYVSFEQALKPLGNVKGPDAPVTAGAAVSVTLAGSIQDLTFDNAIKSYRYTYSASDQTRTVILGSGSALAARLNWVLKYHVRGVTVHGLLDAGNDPAVFAVMQEYAAQTPPAESGVQITWTAQGSPLATTPLTRTQVTWTAPNNPGTYDIAASISGISRGQTSVIVGGAAPTPTPVVTSTTGTPGTTECQLKAGFVADVTVPDNSKFDKGAAFTKTWRVKNSGVCDWPADTKLVFISGNKLSAAQTEIPVGVVKVGETKDISVDMKAPDQDAANVAGLWQFRAGTQKFGSLSVVIVSGNPQVAQPAPAPSSGPVAPPTSGPTMYGIHAHWAAVYNEEAGMENTANTIADLGLGWTKLQVRWGEEDYYDDCSGDFDFDWNHTNEVINTAGGRGQRVLFSVVTSPPCTHPWTGDVHAPPDDPNVFAAFVGELAARYAGRGIAIEVWNEQNLDREWVSNPQTLDAKRYTAMLAASYNKIKAADPNAIVISGALAPTGCNNGINCADDFEYLNQMKAAGADKYMDCVGTHVNALRVPPDASLGGQYDNLFSPPHHSWYFKDTVQGYQTRMGRQACITEFGVASEQNVGHVTGFEWAQGNTEGNQADWVTQGMALAKQWGARMVILWNLDYGSLSGLNDNALYSFFTPSFFKRPVYGAVKSWCASNGCK